jgi:hypothetical protein
MGGKQMSEHTPGPWQVDYELLATFENDGRTEELIEIVGDSRGNTPCYATSKVDARLIAAAPDMLAALKELDDTVNEPNDHKDGWEAALERASNKARAAIAKAEGKS